MRHHDLMNAYEAVGELGAVGTQDAVPPYVVWAAVITGVCTIIGAIIALVGRKEGKPAIPQQYQEHHYHFDTSQRYAQQPEPGGETRRGRPVLALMVFIGGVVVTATLIYFGSQSQGASSASSPPGVSATTSGSSMTSETSTTPPAGEPSGAMPSASALETAQGFMDRYRAAYKAKPTAETLAAYWQFPLKWYFAPQLVPDAPTLLHVYLRDGKAPDRPTPDPCPYGEPRVVSANAKGDYVEIQVVRTWELRNTSKSGTFATYYDVHPASLGEPFRIFRVSQAADLQVCK